MRDDSEGRCFVNHLIAEHRRLHSLLRQMRLAIAQSVGPDEQPSFVGVQQVLIRLREELEQHFAEEESGGCLDEAVSRCPRLAAEVQQIEAEHSQILAELNRLIARTKLTPPTHPNQLAVQREFDHLCQKLCEHERAENAVLAHSFGVNVNGDESEQPTLTMDV